MLVNSGEWGKRRIPVFFPRPSSSPSLGPVGQMGGPKNRLGAVYCRTFQSPHQGHSLVLAQALRQRWTSPPSWSLRPNSHGGVVVPDGTKGIRGLSLPGSCLHTPLRQMLAIRVPLSSGWGTLVGPLSQPSEQLSASNQLMPYSTIAQGHWKPLPHPYCYIQPCIIQDYIQKIIHEQPWILTEIRWFLDTQVYHLLCLLPFWLKSSFHAPTTPLSIY